MTYEAFMDDRELVQKLLERQESDDLDFKSEEYNLTNSHGRSRFIKDILALANTPKSAPAYILLGVLEQSGKVVGTPGITEHPDEADLGRIVAGRVRPTPNFSYRQVEYSGREFGLIEVPVEQPGVIVPRADFEVLRINTVYIRKNTQNIEAAPEDLARIFRSPQAVSSTSNDLTEFTTDPPRISQANPYAHQEQRPAADAREVFVVHGRNNGARDALFQFLRSIDLHPIEWNEAVQSTGKASPYIGEILEAAFSRAHAVVVLFTPDDEARLRKALQLPGDSAHERELSGQARPNVLFEAGMAMGRSEDRTILVEVGLLRPFSDVAGRHVIRLDNSTQRRQDLAHRLRIAGCPINLEGTGWHTEGDFESLLVGTSEGQSESGAVADLASSEDRQFTISDDANALLVEVVEDADGGNGAVLIGKTLGGTFIQTNGKTFGDPKDRRSIARWEKAINELVTLGCLEDPYGHDEYFQVTHKGFEAADRLRAA